MSKIYKYTNSKGKEFTVKYTPKIQTQDLINKVNNSLDFEQFLILNPEYKISKKLYYIIKQSIEFGLNLMNE